MKSKVVLVDSKLNSSLTKLKNSKTESKNLYKFLTRAFEDLERDCFCGTQIEKDRIPKKYREGFDNLWKYDLPKVWRLLYALEKPEDGEAVFEVRVIAVVLDWLPHDKYERVFGY